MEIFSEITPEPVAAASLGQVWLLVAGNFFQSIYIFLLRSFHEHNQCYYHLFISVCM